MSTPTASPRGTSGSQAVNCLTVRRCAFPGSESSATAAAKRINDLEAVVSRQHIDNAQGCNIRYGIAPDKLYMSWIVYGADEVKLTALIKGQEYYVAVDSFNENGITPGEIIRVA